MYADVAQLAEQLICNQQVNGSSPFIGLVKECPKSLEVPFFVLGYKKKTGCYRLFVPLKVSFVPRYLKSMDEVLLSSVKEFNILVKKE